MIVMHVVKNAIVEALILCTGREMKIFKGEQRAFVIYECPKPTYAVKHISFQAKTGVWNPYAISALVTAAVKVPPSRMHYFDQCMKIHVFDT